jgi:hypothetical protein
MVKELADPLISNLVAILHPHLLLVLYQLSAALDKPANTKVLLYLIQYFSDYWIFLYV